MIVAISEFLQIAGGTDQSSKVSLGEAYRRKSTGAFDWFARRFPARLAFRVELLAPVRLNFYILEARQMTGDEKELGQAAVSMCKILKTQAQLTDGMRISQEAFLNVMREMNPQLTATFLDYRKRIDEELTDRPLLQAIKLLDAMIEKLQKQYGPWSR
jgi:hypothetical protein